MRRSEIGFLSEGTIRGIEVMQNWMETCENPDRSVDDGEEGIKGRKGNKGDGRLTRED